MVVSYYSLQPPVPASKFQRYPVSAPSKKISIGKNFSSQHSEGHSDTVWSVAISPDSQTSLVAVETRRSNFGISALENCTPLWAYGSGFVRCPESDGQTLVSSSWDHTIKIWNLHTEQLRRTSLAIPTKFGPLS